MSSFSMREYKFAVGALTPATPKGYLEKKSPAASETKNVEYPFALATLKIVCTLFILALLDGNILLIFVFNAYSPVAISTQLGKVLEIPGNMGSKILASDNLFFKK